MSTAAPVSGWSSTVSLTAGARYSYTVTPGAGGSVVMQWTDGTNWFNFSNSAFTSTSTGLIPAAATGIRGQGFVTAGSFDTASADPLYPSFLGNVANEAAMLALTGAIIGQSVRRIDTGTIWTLFAQPASTAANWVEAAGGSSSASSGGGGGSDRTAVTTEVDPVNGGYRVLTETVDGIPWTYGYDAQGRLITRTWAAGGLLATITYDANGFGTASGNIFVDGGAIATAASQMATLKTALAALGTAVSAVFVVDNGMALGWNDTDDCFRPANAASVIVYQSTALVTVTDPGATEATVYTATGPAWLRGVNGRWVFRTLVNCQDAVVTKTPRHRLNSANVVGGGSASLAAELTFVLDTEVYERVSDAIRWPPASALIGSGEGANSGTAVGTATIASGTDFTFTSTLQLTTTSDPETVSGLFCLLEYFHA